MNRTIDVSTVRTEVRRLVDSKPVHAAAGAGMLASETIRELPARIARLREETPVASLPTRASEYVASARAKAVVGYDKLALRGESAIRARNGKPALRAKTGRTTKAK